VPPSYLPLKHYALLVQCLRYKKQGKEARSDYAGIEMIKKISKTNRTRYVTKRKVGSQAKRKEIEIETMEATSKTCLEMDSWSCNAM
jgi:hypothetical protein